MSNYGTGFAGFKTAIEEVTEALGGAHTREAVAKNFSDSLTRTIQARKGDRYPSFSSVQWTEATDLDFDHARDATLGYLRRFRDPETAVADWNGAKLEHRGDVIVLSGGGFSMLVAMVSQRDEWDRRANANVPKWHIHITDDGKRLTDKDRWNHGSPASTTAKSAETGQKSLRKIVETFFKVKFDER
jgi:hypothetical protein